MAHHQINYTSPSYNPIKDKKPTQQKASKSPLRIIGEFALAIACMPLVTLALVAADSGISWSEAQASLQMVMSWF